MSMETFYKIMNILPELENVDLTPIMGDPLMDEHLIERMDYLEQSDNVKHFDFVTNLVGLTPEMLDRMFSYEKFGLFISIYGDTHLRYKLNTERDLLTKFRENFLMLYDKICLEKRLPFPITFYFRGCKFEKMYGIGSDVAEKIYNLMLIFKNISIDEDNALQHYNWGGQHKNIDEDDLVPIMPMKERKGLCIHADEQHCIFPNGDTSLCGMVDVHKKMLFGNILEEGIEVFDNPVYMSLCKNCNEYEPKD
jgi:sulfatase maturation enzyme AslB (radical SAM superfamily)